VGSARSVARRTVHSACRMLPFKRQLATALRPLPLPWSVRRELRFDGVVLVKVDRSHAFRMAMSGRLTDDLFWCGYGRGREAMSLRVWAALIPVSKTIFDIGSNVGVYALAARTIAPEARVVAFEPIERMYRRLVTNRDLNGYEIDAEQLAVSDRSGAATIYDAERAVFNMASLEHAAEGKGKVVRREVQAVRLDDYCAEHGIEAIDLLKLDIEGHEPAALRGMGELLRSGRPTMLIEVLTDDTAREVWSLLEPLGYEAYRIHERSGIERVHSLAGQSGVERNYVVCQPDSTAHRRLEPALIARSRP
jgi:FkbM family methyltransferase